MKNVEQQSIKKICNFYVSDIHLSVMLLPYINNEINDDVEITTIFEKINKENFEMVLNKINTKNKEKILKINWIYNCTKEEIKNKINNLFFCGKKNTIIIGGGEKFISNINNIINEELKKVTSTNLIKIIDCYDIEKIENKMDNIIYKYDKILNTLNNSRKI
jgi:hypothetical protein